MRDLSELRAADCRKSDTVDPTPLSAADTSDRLQTGRESCIGSHREGATAHDRPSTDECMPFLHRSGDAHRRSATRLRNASRRARRSRERPVDRALSRLLLELYHVVWHFNPMCAAAASRMPDEHRAGPLLPVRPHARGIGPRGMGPATTCEASASRAGDAAGASAVALTLALNGYNYWAADRRHPCSVLGMMYALEVIASVYGGPFAIGDHESRCLLEATAASRSSARTRHGRRAHGRTAPDPQHGRRSTSAREPIVESTIVNFHHFTRVFEAI